jgi:hypothetical protein
MAWSIFTDGGGPEVAVGWAQQALRQIGAPVTPGNVQFMYDWEKSEGGGGKFNPLNQGPVPGQPNLTTTGQQYGGGAADYASWQAGLLGFQDYMNMSNYTGIRDALIANQPTKARALLFASPWASSHYGGGSKWSNVPVPGGSPILPPATAATAAASGDQAECMWTFPNLNPGSGLPLVGSLFPSTSFCVLSKSEARAFIGTLVLVAGSGILLVGAVIMVAWGFQKTGGLSTAANVADKVPGGQGVSAGLSAANARMTRTRAPKPKPPPKPPKPQPQGRHAKTGPNAPASGKHAKTGP